ncbi:PEP-CTERM sorting domain-containing protein [Rubritalea tangerina]|uniref:PEP-CTERM sorting domain-containing protein n=1 Tax=Rubritalea tangerina TaxID=430798 RepID=A0ABW4Z8Q3_9BACT
MKLLTTAAVIGVASMGASQAALIFDTLPINNSGQSDNLGQSFTTGILGAENILNTIVLQGATNAGSGTEDFNATLRIYADLSGDHTDWNQGALLASSDTQAVSLGNNTTFTFSGLNAITLNDNTVYLIEFDDGSTSNARLAFGSDPGTLGSSGGEAFRFIDSGAGTASVLSGNDFALQINTTAVPEPSSTALLGLAGLSLLLRRRR